jgi:ATP-dependent RNA helicase DOB1
LVFLSATISNAIEFAEWVATLKKKPCHVISTDHRPTPLSHFVFAPHGDGLFLVKEHGTPFRVDRFDAALASSQQSSGMPFNIFVFRVVSMDNFIGSIHYLVDILLADLFFDSFPAGSPRAGGAASSPRGGKNEKSDVYRLVQMMMQAQYNPAIIFSFSRAECEGIFWNPCLMQNHCSDCH